MAEPASSRRADTDLGTAMKTLSIPELQLTRRRMDGLFVEAGRRAHITARLDGSYGGFREVSKQIVNPPGGGTEGIWVEPLRLLDYVHFYLWDAECGLTSVERHCEQYARHIGYSQFTYKFASHPYLELVKRVWVPRQHEAVVVQLVLKNGSNRPREARLFAECRSRLSLGWPRRDAGPDLHSFHPDLQAVVAADSEHPDWAALWGADVPASACRLGDFRPALLADGELYGAEPGPARGRPGEDRSCTQHELELPAYGTTEFRLVIAGGNRGLGQATRVYQQVTDQAEELLQERIDHYREILERSVRLESPDYQLDKAFLWAKLGTEDFKHDDPELGLCYFAGYPAYNFYFASDTFRILHGAICAGDFEDTREILRMILRYQATEAGGDTLPGEIWHEMSTTGDRISPNFCTLDFPPLLEHFYRWTADREFVEEVYPNLRAAVEWGYLADLDGDGLLENGPEGEMADSAFEDTNMEGSHLSPQLAWWRALRAGARLAAVVGDDSTAGRWLNTAEGLERKLVERYWNESDQRFEETIRPDGSLDSSWRGITVVDAEAVDEGMAQLGLRRLLEEERRLTDPDAFFSWKAAESGFASWREHLSWYLVARGDRARLLLNNHHTDPGATALQDIARVPFTAAAPGHFPEVIGLDDPATSYVRGCAHQAWSAACGVVYPVVGGLFGIAPDAAAHALTVDPHFPLDWEFLRLEGLRVGEHYLYVAYQRSEGSLRAELVNDGPAAVNARLGFPLPSFSEITEVTLAAPGSDPVPVGLDDARFSTRGTFEDLHAYVEISVAAGESCVVMVGYRPAGLALVADRYLERARPGGRAAVNVGVVNNRSRDWSGTLQLQLPEAWPRSGTPLTQDIELPAEAQRGFSFTLEVPEGIRDGHWTLVARLQAGPGLPVASRMVLPVFGPVEVRLDGRAVAKQGDSYALEVGLSNLTGQAFEAEVALEAPAGLTSAAAVQRLNLSADNQAKAEFMLSADQAGEWELPVRVSAPGAELRRQHRIRVLPRERSVVLYSGFLGCPIASDESLELVNMPANYVVRKPFVMKQLLPLADVLLTSDQHDAEFTADQIEDLVSYVDGGGRLLLFCYWSSAWGRGFHDTYGNVAGTRLAEILPLHMHRGIEQGTGVRLAGPGREVLGGIEWDHCPPFDFNRAEARPGAEIWATSDSGQPVIARSDYGQGQVMAIAIDCFGFGSTGSFLSWPGVPATIRQCVHHLRQGSE